MDIQIAFSILSKIKGCRALCEIVGSSLTAEPEDSDIQDDRKDIFSCGAFIDEGTKDIQANLLWSDSNPSNEL